MTRLLLLLPSQTYRARAFLAAAENAGVALTIGADQDHLLSALNPSGFLRLNFDQIETSRSSVLRFHDRYPIDAVLGVDDRTAILASFLGELIEVPHNPLAATRAASDKHRSRTCLLKAGLPVPLFARFPLETSSEEVAAHIPFPMVIKPIHLSASRGVIRANTLEALRQALSRLRRILELPGVASSQGASKFFQAEAFIPGREVALEGLLDEGGLQVLALFDKPDPLDGPFFEETLYVTPSRLAEGTQWAIAESVVRGARALGLRFGPVHAELRVNGQGPWLLELAARSIGGDCSRAIRFDAGISLEALIIAQVLARARSSQPAIAALGLDVSFRSSFGASGVMMLPIPRGGVLRGFSGQAQAAAVAGIEEVSIAAHIGQTLVPLPEGHAYLGFIFARGETAEDVEQALRRSHGHLSFDIR